MTRRRFLRTHRLSILAALTAALAAVGLMAFVASAGADFNIETGTLLLANGGTTTTPPTGSWVLLSNKTTGVPFDNSSTKAANQAYTTIDGSAPGVGLTFGAAQPGGGIFGPLTVFNAGGGGVPFDAITLVGSDPLLTFSGTDSQTGVRTLLGGNLLGLWIAYAGALYDVETQYNTFNNSNADTQFPLRGQIVGNTLATKPPFATILLNWATGILEDPDFAAYNALFNWVGTYDLP
jgi:hypothetical protein